MMLFSYLKIPLLTLVLFCAASPLTLAQEEVDLRKDSSYFQFQDTVYQEWLVAVGLGEYLQKDRFSIRKRKLTYALSLNFMAADTATYAWRQLKRDFEKDKALSLEEQLFSKLANLMEVEYRQLVLKIYNIPPFGELPVIDSRIYFDPEKGKIVWKETFRSEVPDSVFIQEFKLCEQYNEHSELLQSRKLPEEWKYHVYKKLTKKILTYFKGRVDTVYVINENPIELRVVNIKSEVIPAGTFDIFNPHEMLTYQIGLKRDADGRLLLSCTVDGKFGNGLWELRKLNGFQQMFPDYEAELTTYARQFTRKQLVDMLDAILIPD